MAKKKTRREELVEYIGDDGISGDTAIIASGMVLMEAAEVCKNTADTDGLIRIAHAWFDIAKMLMNYSEEEESKNRPFGFTALEEMSGDDESTSGAEVRSKFRKL
jgi:hypothetical protein